jgi:hypothetical protein
LLIEADTHVRKLTVLDESFNLALGHTEALGSLLDS